MPPVNGKYDPKSTAVPPGAAIVLVLPFILILCVCEEAEAPISARVQLTFLLPSTYFPVDPIVNSLTVFHLSAYFANDE